MDVMIREFSLQMLRKLQFKPANGHNEVVPMEPEQEEVVDIIMDDIAVPKENGIHAEGQDQTEEKVPVAVDGEKEQAVNQEETTENSQPPEDDLVQTPYLPERIELPAQKAQVLQHVELLFALSVKIPDLLEE
jgi:symplekin